MAKVVRKQYQNGEYEDLESMLRRFKRKVNDELILNEIKKREFYLSPSQKKRKKREEAEQRRRKAERMQRKFAYRSNSDDDKKPMYRPHEGNN